MSASLLGAADRFKTLAQLSEKLTEGPQAALAQMRTIGSEFENGLQTDGFSHCARTFAAFNRAIDDILRAYEPTLGAFNADEVMILQFFASDTIQSLEAYIGQLKAKPEDSEQQAKMRLPTIEVLSSWRPTIKSSVPVAAAPALAPAPAPPAAPTVAPANVSPEVAPDVSRTGAATASSSDVPAAASTAAINEAIAAPVVAVAAEQSTAMGSASAVVAAPAVDERHRFLICRSSTYGKSQVSNQRTFAIPITQVLEVIDSHEVNPLPFPRRGLAGILNFRGDPLPILECADRGPTDRLKNPDAKSRKDYIVIAKVGAQTFGFEMEQVLSVTDLNPSEFQAPASVLALSTSTWVTHLVRREDEIVLVMDLKKAVA